MVSFWEFFFLEDFGGRGLINFIFVAVVNELEGLARGGRDRDMSHMSLTEQAHAADVSECARTALAYLRSSARPSATIRCVTMTGKFLNSFTTFTTEEDFDRVGSFLF